MTTEYMKEAYGLLFEIETGLRGYVESTMLAIYGAGWQIAAPASKKYKISTRRFDSFHYHELISMLRAYSCFDVLPKDTYPRLLKIVPIRNKIAHCKIVTEEESMLLQDVHTFVMEYIQSSQVTS